jgi:hypothetical protein
LVLIFVFFWEISKKMSNLAGGGSGGGAGGPASKATMTSAFFLGFIALSRARLNAQAKRNFQLPNNKVPQPLFPSNPPTNQANTIWKHDVLNWNNKNRVIIIGDVHGCADELENLLKEVGYLRGKDILIFVGDLVRKGPDSKRVVKIARELNAVTVRGNHDQYAIEDPSNSLGLLDEDLEYLRNTPLSLTIPQLDTLVVHAGIVPGIPIQTTEPLVLMTMRNIVEGKPTPSEKEGAPWISLWNGPTHVVFGHDAKRGLQKTQFATGLDTGCVYGKTLTALVLPEKKLISVMSTRPLPAAHQRKNSDPSRL